jgi:hypothetical protein
MRSLSRVWLLLAVVAACLVLFGLPSASASSANISHSYDADGTIVNGDLVGLEANKPDYVQLANTGNGTRLLGVAVNSGDSLLAVDASTAKIQVATSGSAGVLVTTLNGNINVGDEIGVSPFNGLGMKAVANSHIVGLAEASFNSQSSGATLRQVKDESNHTKQIWVGFTQVSLAVSSNSTPAGGSRLSFLQKIAKSLTGHTISTFRILISIVILLLAVVVLVAIIHASIYGSLLSVGRNPLAKDSIIRALIYITTMAILLVSIAASAIFFLLK